jgi:hypothetical protein
LKPEERRSLPDIQGINSNEIDRNDQVVEFPIWDTDAPNLVFDITFAKSFEIFPNRRPNSPSTTGGAMTSAPTGMDISAFSCR